VKRLLAAIVLAAGLALLTASSAAAAFGLSGFDVRFSGPSGEAQMQAGSHPFAMETSFAVNLDEKGFPEGAVKELDIAQVPGLAGIPNAVPPCSTLDFLTRIPEVTRQDTADCANGSAVGLTTVEIGLESGGEQGTETRTAPVYNLEPPPGVAAKLGFYILNVPVTVDVGVSEEPPYEIVASVKNVSQVLEFYGAKFTIWGVPGSPAHDSLRGQCVGHLGESLGKCPAGVGEVPFLISPRACEGPLESIWKADSWLEPGIFVGGEGEGALTHDDAQPTPNPEGFGGCGSLGFAPRLEAVPSTDRASSPSGLAASLQIADEGIKNPKGLAGSDLKRAEVILPKGVTLNPSLAEGLVACTEAQLELETASSGAGEGCPEASKVGTVQVTTPLLEETLSGSLYVAEPYENPAHSLIALYMVIRDPGLGVSVKLTGEVSPDPKTGQIVTVFEETPQLPVSGVTVHLREGGRSPLISPSLCGTYTTVARLTPWADPSEPVEVTSSFNVSHGLGGGPCPAGGTPPFEPGFDAGALDNSAGRYSPFDLRLTRPDGNQDLVRFSATLPPGALARLAGTTECPEADIALARSRADIASNHHGGEEELEHPSCPASSQIGSLQAGAGVGSELTYVPGKVYLAGPFNGAPLSVVAITPAVAGPFDVGDVVVRQALRVNPRTGVASVDGTASDPIPHILAGIPLSVRDIRVSVDKPNFTINPTDCQRFGVSASIWGGGADPFSTADDSPVFREAPFRAAGCAALRFAPKMALSLKGGTKRGSFPQLRATYTPRAGDANLKNLVLRLPHSEFVEQGHFRTICTRVQYAAGTGNGSQCPPGSVYGSARAYTPLLEAPLEGPVYLRSSNHNLPDVVLSLHGLIDVEVPIRIDSIHGQLRASLEEAPDAPLTKAEVNMQGGSKGLIVNSTNLCKGTHRAKVSLLAQNSKSATLEPKLQTSCKAKKQKRKH
jgi:hypothetical protein